MRSPPVSTDPRPHPARADALATLVLLGAFALAALVPALSRRLGPHPSQDECLALLDRYVEHLARARSESPRPSAVESWREAARKAASSSPTLSRCTELLTVDEAACAKSAPDADAFERCLP